MIRILFSTAPNTGGVRIDQIVDSNDSGVTITTTSNGGKHTVKRFYPWTSVAYIETRESGE